MGATRKKRMWKEVVVVCTTLTSAGGAEESHRNLSEDSVVRAEMAPVGFRSETILPEVTCSSLSACLQR
jgi:hypothetical protein